MKRSLSNVREGFKENPRAGKKARLNSSLPLNADLLVKEISKHLKPVEICKLLLVNQDFYNLFNSDGFWRFYTCYVFHKNNLSWKNYFSVMYDGYKSRGIKVEYLLENGYKRVPIQLKSPIGLNYIEQENWVRKAIDENDTELLKKVVNYEIGINWINGGFNSLRYAVVKGNLFMVKYIVELGADINMYNGIFSLLDEALKKKYSDICLYLIRKGIYLKLSQYDSPLLKACQNGMIEVCELLLEKGLSIEECRSSRPLLQISSKRGDYDIVSLLLKNGADPWETGIRDRGSLHYACENGHYKVVKELIKWVESEKVKDYVNTNLISGTPLYLACKAGHNKLVLFLLKKGAKPNRRCLALHVTPLHVACRNNFPLVVNNLCRYGAKTFIQDIDGSTPKTVAEKKRNTGCLEIIKMFS